MYYIFISLLALSFAFYRPASDRLEEVFGYIHIQYLFLPQVLQVVPDTVLCDDWVLQLLIPVVPVNIVY